MYQLTLSLKERQELVQVLFEKIDYYEEWLRKVPYGTDQRTIEGVKEKLAHLENIKLKVEQAKISPVKGLTE
jgi:hypothetical protein